jgi:hypothetical protein
MSFMKDTRLSEAAQSLMLDRKGNHTLRQAGSGLQAVVAEDKDGHISF